jgi:hypothetical protein
MTNILIRPYTLRPDILLKIRTSQTNKAQLMYYYRITQRILQFWFYLNKSYFTQYDLLSSLKDYFKENAIEDLIINPLE